MHLIIGVHLEKRAHEIQLGYLHSSLLSTRTTTTDTRSTFVELMGVSPAGHQLGERLKIEITNLS